jgi:hypothetical protein
MPRSFGRPTIKLQHFPNYTLKCLSEAVIAVAEVAAASAHEEVKNLILSQCYNFLLTMGKAAGEVSNSNRSVRQQLS